MGTGWAGAQQLTHLGLQLQTILGVGRCNLMMMIPNGTILEKMICFTAFTQCITVFIII